MAAKSPISTKLTGNRLWLWVLAFFGLVLLVMVVVYLVKKGQQSAKGSTGQKAPSSGTSAPPYIPPTLPGSSTPPALPPEPTSGQGSSKPVDVYNANWAYLQEIAWKMYDTYFDRNDFRCEVSNGIIEMGENDLRALVQLYKQWYNRSLKNDYCQKITASGCWTSWWDDKPATACNRLKQLN